jgi:hypothetical protein
MFRGSGVPGYQVVTTSKLAYQKYNRSEGCPTAQLSINNPSWAHQAAVMSFGRGLIDWLPFRGDRSSIMLTSCTLVVSYRRRNKLLLSSLLVGLLSLLQPSNGNVS